MEAGKSTMPFCRGQVMIREKRSQEGRSTSGEFNTFCSRGIRKIEVSLIIEQCTLPKADASLDGTRFALREEHYRLVLRVPSYVKSIA